MKIYYELEIAFNKSNIESIYNTLYLHNIKSIIEENGIIKTSLPEKNRDLLNLIKTALINNKHVTENDIHISKFDNLDWNKEWEKSIEPVYIKDKIIIYPSWKKDTIKEYENKILIEINPKMSFGTGHNETTQLILEMMCDNINSNDRTMLDFGCGTGILSIAAIKLGVKKAVAIDIDNDAIENAKECFEVNNVDEFISLYNSDISGTAETNFNIICANIASEVIIQKLKNIYEKLTVDGKLFITGILNEEKDEIIKKLNEHEFVIKETGNKAEWISFYCLRK